MMDVRQIIEESGLFNGADAGRIEDAVAKHADCTWMSSATLVELVITVLAVYNADANDADESADMLVAASGGSPCTVADLSGYVRRVVPLAAAIDVPLATVLETYVTLTANSVPSVDVEAQVVAGLRANLDVKGDT